MLTHLLGEMYLRKLCYNCEEEQQGNRGKGLCGDVYPVQRLRHAAPLQEDTKLTGQGTVLVRIWPRWVFIMIFHICH